MPPTTITLAITLKTDDPSTAYADLAEQIEGVCARLGAHWRSATYCVDDGEPHDTEEIVAP